MTLDEFISAVKAPIRYFKPIGVSKHPPDSKKVTVCMRLHLPAARAGPQGTCGAKSNHDDSEGSIQLFIDQHDGWLGTVP